MEQWEAIIEGPLEQGHRSFEKILQTASAVLNNAATHLAPFETEWVMETLLFAPVNLLSVVSEYRGDDVWRKAVADALKLLASAVAAGVADQHCQHIADLCMLHYEPSLRSVALVCLAAVARRSDGVSGAARLVATLQDAGQCRAPLAALVGVLCEHHPALVCDEVTGIWRGYLNMLDNKKNTDTVIKAVLEGMCGLFRHFGDHLPIAELLRLYEDISSVYIHKPACQPACFSILGGHASLFRERVSADAALRRALWGAAPAPAVLSVYATTAQGVSKTAFEKILSTEVLPQINSPSSQSKLTALRVLAASKTDAFGDLTRFVDVHTLEYELRRERVPRADADIVLWCVEYSFPNSERLLQASIQFYENLPSDVRKQIIAKGILNATPDVRRAAIQFLIWRCCEDGDAVVWRELHATDGGADNDATLATARELADCLLTAFEAVPEDEELPPKLSALLRLASKTAPTASSPLCACAPLLLRSAALGPAALAAARVLLAEAAPADTAGFYQSIRIDQCRDEATLHEACLALMHAPDDVDIAPDDMLCALQIIFSSDVEPAVHSAALRKLDYLLSNDTRAVPKITTRAVGTLRTRGDRTDRHIRMLHREVTMFLGKHGSVDKNNNTDSLDDVLVDLKRSLAISLPYQGTSYKVDLKTTLLLALRHEPPRALLSLLAVVCANLSSNKDLNTQRATMRVVRALASAHASGADNYTAQIQQAVRLCGDAACGTDMLQYISSTKSCGVRKLLSAALATLCEDPVLLQLIVERTLVMLASADCTTKRAGLDIAETILTILENNNSLSKIILPELIVLIAKTHQSDTKTIFDIASKTFTDKKELFDKETIASTVHSLLENVLKTDISDVEIYKTTVKITIQFIKNLLVNLDEILDMIFGINKSDVDVKLIYVLAVLKSEFGFDTVMARKILGRDTSLLNYLLDLSHQINIEPLKVEAILRFMEEYCEVILELKYTESLQFLSELIPTLTPALVTKLPKNIKTCFSTLHKHLKGTPKQVMNSFQTWVEMQPIKKITDAIERDNFSTEHKLCVESLKIMSNVFDIRELVSDVKMLIQRWPTILLKLYSSGRLELYFYNEMSHFIDILMVSLKFLSADGVKQILKSSNLNKDNAVLFYGFFIRGFLEVLTDRPFILLDEDVKECSVVLNDIVREIAKQTYLKDRCEDVLELVDKLWPTYEKHATFSQKHSLLANLECLPVRLSPDSIPLQWATRCVCSRDVSLDDRARLLCVTPEESLKSPEVMSAVWSLCPARMRELRPLLLEAAAARPAALLRLVAVLADDASAGWWDAALESCLTSIPKRIDLDVYMDVFNRCQSERVCERILVPLLRHSSTEVCEKFLAGVLTKILKNLNKKPKGETAHAGYEKCWDEYMISLHLLLIAFEKLQTWSIESPTSTLYSELAAAPWHLVREACKLVDSLRETSCPPAVADRLRSKFRKFQCMLYNCLSAGICRRRPAAPLYRRLFSDTALAKIVDEHAQYTLPVRASWTVRNKALSVAVPLESTLPSLSHTQRSRIFLRTLSEHPMLFDLHSAEEVEMMEVQDISLRETPLNAHPCAATLTALFQHVAAAPALACLWQPIGNVLKDGHTNLKWLLAQIICNCKEELKPQASVLLPGLLAVLTSTVDVTTRCMNGLHLDVLDTILFWKEDSTSSELAAVAQHLVTTCLELRRKSIFDGLLKTLGGLLVVYGSSIHIEWSSFEPYYEDQNHDTQKALLQLIKVISKNKIYVPQTLSKIVSKFDAEPSKMAECFGLAMAACQDVGEKGEALRRFKKYLEKCSGVTNYVRVLYYASLGCAECCGEQEFRKITDYVTQVTSHDRTKCLHILSLYLSRGCRSEYIADMFELVDLADLIARDHTALLVVRHGLTAMEEALRRRCVARAAALAPAAPGTRRLVLDVMLRACEELFAQPPQPPAKRQKMESTPILRVSREDVYSNSILTCLGLGAVDCDAGVAKTARDALGAMLNKDLGIRFAECFLLTLVLPAHTDKALTVSVCVSALLEMLYSDVRSAESFRNSRLRDEPLPVRQAESSRLLTLSRSFQGTFRSYGATRGRILPQDTNKPAIDVQIPIDSILETLLEFAKTTPEAARVLLIEALSSILSTTFDLAATLVPQLATLLRLPPGELTPVYLDVCRLLVAESSSSMQGLRAPVEQLRALTLGTEGASLTQLLYEEVTIQCLGDTVFQLGQPEDAADVPMDERTTFSIKDLKCAFGKLSNWDDLTLRQRRAISNSLPPLWTDRRAFVTHMDSYEVPTDTQCWFDKMAAAFKQMGPNSVRWLKRMDRWPRRQFEISAITEATSWRHEPTETMPTQLCAADCLAECAGRLMIRSSYYNSLQHSETNGDRVNKLSRSHELKWCIRANEMGLPRVALQCVDRNVEELLESETLPWLRQKMLAVRQMALERDDMTLLRDALDKAKEYTPEYSTDELVSIEMYHLMLQLHKDLKSLTHHELQTILAQVNQSVQHVDWSTSPKKAVSAIFEGAMTHYDESVDTGVMDIDSAVSAMCGVFGHAAAVEVPTADMLLAVLLNRLDEYQGQLGDQTGQQLLEKLSPLVSSLDAFTLELLEKNNHKFPAHLQKSFSAILPKNASAEKYRRCLQLVCDPNHLLTHCCEELGLALRSRDGVRWKSTLDGMKRKIYENPYAGPSFKLLDKHKADLYGMYEFEPTSDFASQAETKLKSIVLALRKEPQTTLRLSDLCPALLDHRQEACAANWFGLSRVTVVKFYDKVQVFTDSIRRPVVLSMLLSNGKTHRAIQKTGERLAGDAAAQCVAATVQRLCGSKGTAYTVTLLDEDSALIEYLEGHERLRTLIGSTCNLDAALSVSRPADPTLAASPAAALLAHDQLCATVPARALRSAIEQNSSCVQDFISKKRNFTDSLADMTLLTWLLGLGDRHLQNILCARDGSVRAVDWGDVWARAAAPPARLSRNMLAMTDTQVLEARLQRALSSLRSSACLLEARVRVSFRWMGAPLQEELQHVRGILRGVTSSYDVTRDVTSRGRIRNKDKHLELLERVLADFGDRGHHSVEEQVSCLLRHCTAPELLSVVRAGWEPWV